MRVVLTAAMTAAIAAPAAAQDTAIRLTDGMSWTIVAQHTRSTSDAAPAQNWSLTTAKRLTLHAGVGGARPTLTVIPISSTPGPNSPKELAQARSLDIPATVYVADDMAPGDIVNVDEVRAELTRLAPSTKGADPKLIDAAAKTMIAAELAIVARGQGLKLKPGAPIKGEAAMSNPLGGPPIRHTLTATLEGVDRASGVATIKWSQAVDPEGFKAAVATMLDELGKRQLPAEKLAEAQTALRAATYDNRTECRYEIDTRTGLARRAECTETTTMAIQGKSQRIVETWAITQSPPEAA